MELRSSYADDFRASQRVLDLGGVTVWSLAFQPLVFRRTPKLIRQSDPETYHLSLVVRGTGSGVWRHRETQYKPDDLLVNSSSLPNDVHSIGAPVSTVALEIPKALVPLPRDAARRIIGVPVSAREGMGALLARFLIQLTEDTAAYQPTDGPRLGTVLTDLAAALFAHLLEAGACLPRRPTDGPSPCASRRSSASTCTTRTSPRPRSPPRTTSPPVICTVFSGTRTPRSPSGSAAGAWRRPAATSPTPHSTPPPSRQSPPAGDSPRHRLQPRLPRRLRHHAQGPPAPGPPQPQVNALPTQLCTERQQRAGRIRHHG